MTASLAQIAPRLAAALVAWRASEMAWDAERRRLIAARCDLERLVAHRDLQLIRSESRRRAKADTRYMAWRGRKLARAQADLDLVVERLAVLERIPPGHFEHRAWRASEVSP
jgi:hypothetical protein